MKRTVTLLLGGIAFATACSTPPPASTPTTTTDPTTQQQLTADVQAIRSAATSGDRASAQSALDALHSHVAAAQGQGRLSAARASTILAAAARVTEDVQTLPSATSPPQTVSPTRRPTPNQPPTQPPGDDNGQHKDHDG